MVHSITRVRRLRGKKEKEKKKRKESPNFYRDATVLEASIRGPRLQDSILALMCVMSVIPILW